MAFTNEYITAADFRKYEIQAVFKKATGLIAADLPQAWSIDRPRKAFLLYLRTAADEHVNRFNFALCWNGAVALVEVEVVDGAHFERNTGTPIAVLRKLRLPSELSDFRQEVISILKEAMLCHGAGGTGDEIGRCGVEFIF